MQLLQAINANAIRSLKHIRGIDRHRLQIANDFLHHLVLGNGVINNLIVALVDTNHADNGQGRHDQEPEEDSNGKKAETSS